MLDDYEFDADAVCALMRDELEWERQELLNDRLAELYDEE